MKEDNTPGGVQVFPDLCVSKESVTLLEGFIPHIRPFAEIIGLNIKIDWPAKKINEFDTRGNIFIHFDTCPEGVNAKINETPNFIFGQRIPGGVVIEEASISSGVSITSPEGDRIAHVSRGNIFIFPRILSNGCTSKEVASILGQILYWSLCHSANFLFDRTKNSKLQTAYRRLRFVLFGMGGSEKRDRISSKIKPSARSWSKPVSVAVSERAEALNSRILLGPIAAFTSLNKSLHPASQLLRIEAGA